MAAATVINQSVGADQLSGYDPVAHQENVVARFTNLGTDSGVTPNVVYGDQAVSVTSALAGAVAPFGSNAAALTANTDYAFKWGAGGATQVNHVVIQNNSTIPINYELDAAATAGSLVLSNVAGQNTVFLDVQVTALHLLGNGTPNVGGSSAANIVVRGWL